MKAKCSGQLKCNVYEVMDEAVQYGVLLGLRHWFKHRDDSPSENQLADMAEQCRMDVMNAIADKFSFD